MATAVTLLQPSDGRERDQRSAASEVRRTPHAPNPPLMSNPSACSRNGLHLNQVFPASHTLFFTQQRVTAPPLVTA